MRHYLYIIFALLSFTFNACKSQEEIEMNDGKSAFDKGQYEEAVEHFKNAAKLNHKNAEVYLLIGRSYLNYPYDGHTKSARIYINKSLKYAPNNAEAYFYLGDTYKWGNEERIINYQKALNIDPRFAGAYYRLGFYHGFIKNNIDLGIDYYKKGMTFNQNFTNIYYNLARLYKAKGDYEKAIENFNIEIKRDYNNYASYIELAQVYLNLKMFDECIGILNTLLAEQPNYYYAHYLLALAYLPIDKNISIENFKVAANLGNDEAKKWLKLNNINY